jgi:Tfp pilus assembly protein PilV
MAVPAGLIPVRRGVPRTGGERGIALILVMVMLLLLSLLGMTLLNSTTTDLQLTVNSRNEGNAFYAAESALEFAQVNALIYSSLTTPGATWPAAGEGKILADDGTPTGTANSRQGYHQIKIYEDAVAKTGEQGTANIKVQFIGSGAVPVGAGTEVDAGVGGGGGFKANFYVISVIAEGKDQHSRAEIESEIARVVPK